MIKPRIAIIENCVDVSGALNSILRFADFAQAEFHFLFIIPTGSKASELIRSKGFDVVEFPFLELSRRRKSLLFYFPKLLLNAVRLKYLADRFQIKIVHVNDFYNMTAVVSKLLGGKFKVICHVRFMPDRFPPKLVQLWLGLNLKYAEAVICVSKAVRGLLPNHSKIKLIYDGLLESGPLLQRAFTENEHVRLLYLGHYIPGKGQDYGLEAFALAYQENPSLRLKFVGGDMELKKNREFKSALIQRTKSLQLDEVVEFAGPTLRPGDEIQTADVVLNFSESESFSLTCLEALTYGTPLIASDCGGPSELFEHEESGWLVPNKDIQAMKEAILQLSGNVGFRKKLSMNSRIFVRRKFAKANTFGKLKALYTYVLNHP